MLGSALAPKPVFSPVDSTPWAPGRAGAALSLLCPEPLEQAGDNCLLIGGSRVQRAARSSLSS